MLNTETLDLDYYFKWNKMLFIMAKYHKQKRKTNV